MKALCWTGAAWRLAMAVAAAMALGGPAAAADGNVTAQGWTAVEAARLEAMRGGFLMPSGLVVSLGIERAVAINGDMVSQSKLYINDLRAIGRGDAEALKTALQPSVTQQGSHNLLSSSAGQIPAGTFVQNALNDQAIATRTVISTTLNSGGLLKEINFMSSVRDANIGAMSPPR